MLGHSPVRSACPFAMRRQLSTRLSFPTPAQMFVLNRCTTGTELGGKLPYSVMTMLM
jgi:hypothetical protein